jgi:hypothetical protein
MTTAVECKLIRKGGTRAEACGTEYHFQPYTDGAHVAVIDNDEHADVFLAIPEGYRLYRGDAQPVADEAEADAEAGDDRAALAQQYQEKFGKSPHGRMSAAKIREALAAT